MDRQTSFSVTKKKSSFHVDNTGLTKKMRDLFQTKRSIDRSFSLTITTTMLQTAMETPTITTRVPHHLRNPSLGKKK